MTEGTDEKSLAPETTLREPLRRIDSILSFARKLVHTGGEIPEGLIDDFMEARTELERIFVAGFARLDPRIQKEMRKFILQTRNLTQRRLKDNLSVVSRKSRSILNALMIHGSPTISLAEDGDTGQTSSRVQTVRFGDTGTSERPAPSGHRRLTLAFILIFGIGAAAVAAAYLAGAFGATPYENSTARLNVPRTNTAPPTHNFPPANTGPAPRFDPVAAGYTRPLRADQLRNPIDPLESGLGDLRTRDLPAVLLGLEGQVYLVEPERTKAKPEWTRSQLHAFALSLTERESEWIEQERLLIDAFIDHVQDRLQLRLYRQADDVLLSDVLVAKGGSRLPLILTVAALGLSANCPFHVIAPSGNERVDLAAQVLDDTYTWNGEDHGLRVGTVAAVPVNELLAALLLKLRPTMKTAGGRALVSAMLLRQLGELDRSQARQALIDLSIDWLTKPTDDAPERAWLLHDVATMLEEELCRVLLQDAAAGTTEEAIELFRLATAARDIPGTERALLLIGKRARPGSMLDGEPLALVIGDLLRARKRRVDAAEWYERALKEHPDDPRPALRLLDSAEGQRRHRLMLEAYVRGEREADFLRGLAILQAGAGENLSALALLDELTASKAATAADFHTAALLCLTLEHPDWAQERIARAGDLGDADLLRLDLICELQRHGLSDRARQLSEQYRAIGRSDPFLQSLLRRYGG